jgi:hypothetical protein
MSLSSLFWAALFALAAALNLRVGNDGAAALMASAGVVVACLSWLVGRQERREREAARRWREWALQEVRSEQR